MNKNFQATFLALSGLLAILFLGNFLVHLIFYIMDGNLGKFASPVWLGLNGVMLFLTAIFVIALKKEKVSN